MTNGERQQVVEAQQMQDTRIIAFAESVASGKYEQAEYFVSKVLVESTTDHALDIINTTGRN